VGAYWRTVVIMDWWPASAELQPERFRETRWRWPPATRSCAILKEHPGIYGQLDRSARSCAGWLPPRSRSAR